MAKTSLWRIPSDHFRTLTDHATGKPSIPDLIVQVGVPLVGGAVAAYFGAVLPDVSGAVAGVSIVAGLLFSMAVFLFQLRLGLENDQRLGADDRALIDECMSNVLWAILLGLGLALYLVVCGAGDWLGCGIHGRVLTGIAIAAAGHFLMVLAMSLKRLRRSYERIAMRVQ